MKQFSVPMALVDLVPVLLFAIAGVILMRDLYNKMSKGAFALFAAGLIDVTAAGALKALYKLLYALGACDFASLSSLMFPLQSLGFLLAGIGAVAMLAHRQSSEAVCAAAPPLFGGTFIFVGLMVAGLGMLDAALCILAKRLKKTSAILLLIFSFLASLAMGYLSSHDFNQASMNWIAQGVNILGQAALLLGILLMHRSGLSALALNK
ncbi:MAG: hypothetical protein II697_07570 [Clostridia bacterium]|nr:hypothetical protein [Clostridia bacterium]